MTTKRAILYGILLSLIVAILLLVRCEREIKEVIASDNTALQSKADTATAKITVLQDSHDTIAKEIGKVTKKAKERTRVEKLLPKRSSIIHDSTISKTERVEVSTNDSTTVFLNARYDSVQKEMVYKEMLLDSLTELTNKLLAVGLEERRQHEIKDSANHAIIVNLNNDVDALKEDNKKLAKRLKRRIAEIKIALGVGYAAGVATSFIAK